LRSNFKKILEKTSGHEKLIKPLKVQSLDLRVMNDYEYMNKIYESTYLT